MTKKQVESYWAPCPRGRGWMEWVCPCGVGHGNHIHGCCGKHCCQREDYPGRKHDKEAETSNEQGI